MRKLFIALAVLGLSIALAAPAFCDQPEEYEPGYGHGGGWGPGQMMGSGHHGWGMRGPDWGRHSHWWGWGPSGHGWKSMKPEQRKKWEKMRSDFQMETLEIRKQLASKHMELETLWAQPNVDSIKVEKLSKEVAELEAELGKLTSGFGHRISARRLKLTPRETEICHLIRNRLSNKEI